MLWKHRRKFYRAITYDWEIEKLMKNLLLLTLLFCAHLGFARGQHSGIAGEVLIGGCPVSFPGFECPLHPYQTSITIYSETGEFIRKVRTDKEGLFAIKLKPGVYTLVPAGPQQTAHRQQNDQRTPPAEPVDSNVFPGPGGPPPPDIPPVELVYPFAEPFSVEVEFGEFTTVTILYDNGVR